MTVPDEIVESVPVHVVVTEMRDKTPQDVRVLGCSRGIMKSIAITGVSAADPPMLAGKDVRRSRITMWAECNSGGTPVAVYFGTKEDVQTAAQGGLRSGPGIWTARPPGSAPIAPLHMQHIDEIFVAIPVLDITNTVTVTVVTERWDAHGHRE
jgi:hypothetical protein